MRIEMKTYSPFYAIEKGAVLQEARCFNDPHIDPRRCQQVITKLLYLLTQGETLTKKEASEVFFSVTKLYQSKDANLRRMVYLVIKDVCPGADEVIIITSSLMKDMNSKTDLYRSNAIRVLCSITDSQLLGQIERYLKQAIVDKAAVVASAVLVSALHLLGHNSEIVKRWTNEIQEAVQSKHSMVQFHAVALLHALRANDRLAVSKLVTSLTKSNVRSSLAQCLLVRYVAQVIAESTASGSGQRPFYDFLESCLRHKAELVIFEAARAIVAMPEVTNRELAPAITVLQLFLTSSKPVLRFASVRTLNKVAMTHPGAVAATNLDLEALISDSNRTIATLAITTLLKTGNEGSVERLLKQIGSFMSDIADDFKIVVVEAIRSLCLKFPQKYRALMNFLSNVLREDGGFEYKKAIVDSILILIKDIPDAKEPGLGHLCEFIEDCEFTYLSTQILHLLGVEGPKTKDPAKYIRFIYNRIILENATVRAAAVSSLAKFGALVEDLRPRIRVLLSRALHDNDDEVRDRATLYLAELDGNAGGPQAIDVQWNIPPKNLEKSLRAYLENGTDKPFDLASVPKAVPQAPQKDQKKKSGPAAVSKPEPVMASQYVDALRDIPELAHVGPLFKSAEPLLLTEEETEYNIAVVVHIFAAHVLLQFNCTNTVQEQVLENVSVAVDLSEAEEFEQELSLPLARMEYGSVGQTYVLLQRPPDSLSMGKLGANLQFTVKEIDPSSGEAEEDGYEDEYQLEDIDIGAANYIKAVPVSNFRKAWEDTDPASEISDDYGLGVRDSLQDAVEAVMSILGMAPCDGSDAVPPNARSHTLLLAGHFVGDVPALARISFGIDIGRNVAMKLVSRSDQHEISDFLHQIIQS
ncbi:Coatomer, gamma subunit [Coccomyxa subellipsoidea C-169]|uniref:Coatomer subunit gamma n=1 Tax=Coccomyxa subellipsoidea (strain C-169) TaxID=574566 RepID=I0Z9Q2_COCSC|nr:Coatomer, gamma subunit [Coccomyxa subellipsoidea C-169]EIE27371.1 Coatomer, gamma subunit [Coccomyxa subellipsoidea C-169]|eukprot:XP_005651915.1 Coatomer, gamma subunit [Coccomyxa subellipsoidea C-169]